MAASPPGTSVHVPCLSAPAAFSVFFDVNGFKKPNRLGVDVFAWAVNGKGKIVRYTDPSISIGNDEPDYNYAFEIMENGWIKKY